MYMKHCNYSCLFKSPAPSQKVTYYHTTMFIRKYICKSYKKIINDHIG